MNAASGPRLPPDVDVYLVEEQPNPSTDFFVMPACQGAGRRVHRRGFDDVPSVEALAGAVVVFVRYVPAAWRSRVWEARARLIDLVFFMDDDVLDVRAAQGMPWRYRYKLFHLAARHAGWLRRARARLWVSTPWLARKYAFWSPESVPARPVVAPEAPCRVFYHGSASHEGEVRWLRPVVERVLAQDERVVFEIVGGPDVYRMYRRLPRVTVVHPMKWPAYQAFLAMTGRDIGLAPMLDLPFNRARSCTKFFDITNAGAVGLYAQDSLCGEVVRDGIDGLLLPMEPSAWVEAILALAADSNRRAMLLEAARSTVRQRAAG